MAYILAGFGPRDRSQRRENGRERPGDGFSGPGDHSGPILSHFCRFRARPPMCDLNVMTLPQLRFLRLEHCVLRQDRCLFLQQKTSVFSQRQTSVLSQQQTSVLSQHWTFVLSRQKTSVLSQQQTSAASEAAWPSWRSLKQKLTKSVECLCLSSRPPIPLQSGEGQCHFDCIFTITSRTQAPRNHPRFTP